MSGTPISSVPELCQSLAAPAPPAGLSVSLSALWWAANDGWDEAHALCPG